MHHLLSSDIPQAAGMLARAFFNDPLYAYFFPSPVTRPRLLERFFLFRLHTELEEVYVTSAALEGLAIWQAPREHRSPWRLASLPAGLRMAARVGWAALLRLMRYQRWSERLRAALIRDPYWYLDTLAVAPAFQRQGFARRLIVPTLHMADDAGRPVYLETQNRRNVDIYTHFGFQVIAHARLPGSDVEHYCLYRR